jgi:hypothetical protein
MEIEQLIAEIEASGVAISLTPEGKIRISGTSAANKSAARRIRPQKAAAIACLKERAAVASPTPPTEAAEETLELGAEDTQFSSCPYCQQPLIAPDPAVQVRNFQRWQQGHDSYYHWTDGQLGRLQELLANALGDVLMLPAYAHSVNIRRPDGSVYRHCRVK